MVRRKKNTIAKNRLVSLAAKVSYSGESLFSDLDAAKINDCMCLLNEIVVTWLLCMFNCLEILFTGV